MKHPTMKRDLPKNNNVNVAGINDSPKDVRSVPALDTFSSTSETTKFTLKPRERNKGMNLEQGQW